MGFEPALMRWLQMLSAPQRPEGRWQEGQHGGRWRYHRPAVAVRMAILVRRRLRRGGAAIRRLG